MLDKLRVCIICRYYSMNGQLDLNDYINHPAMCRLKRESLDKVIEHMRQHQQHSKTATATGTKHDSTTSSLLRNESIVNEFQEEYNYKPTEAAVAARQLPSKVNLFVGNVSKSLIKSGQQKHHNLSTVVNDDESVKCTMRSSQYNSELITHKWMCYVRSSSDSIKLEHYIRKVIFHLHFSYKPHDLIEIK